MHKVCSFLIFDSVQPLILIGNWQGTYLKWVQETPGAVNKLPEYLAEQCKKRDDNLKQTAVTAHFEKAERQEPILPYSNELFKEAAIEWLIATDQVSTLSLGADLEDPHIFTSLSKPLIIQSFENS